MVALIKNKLFSIEEGNADAKKIYKNYIIKDEFGIINGRIYIVEYSEKNHFTSFRIEFYKDSESNDYALERAIYDFCSDVFKSGIKKISIYVPDNINTKPFTRLNFEIEGIIRSFEYKNGNLLDELIFGIDKETFCNSNIINNIVLSGERVKLKVLNPNNAEELLAYYLRNKEHLKKFEPSRSKEFYTLFVQKKLLEESYRQYINGSGVSFGIFLSDKLIGKLQISSIILGSIKSAFVGYSIDERMQNKGYMKEALKLSCDYAFSDLGLHRIEASTIIDNIKSQRVLLSCGFNKLGLNEKYLFIDGKWKDHITFYKIREDK